MNHVSAVLDQHVHVICDSALRQTLLMRGSSMQDRISLSFKGSEELDEILSLLQSLQIPFADTPAGWPPAAVFAQLRDQGLVQGTITTVVWVAPDMPVLGVG
ncbi:hypothetical protein [Xanthomonas arboricola]|uniref:hypothetical protein n=1 Tax=Xanthomonas arboricola TaxID=56448 RepID=UPI000CEF3EA8|nr:hypothetical protein [Xanthomonas arboricola]MBB5859260.1 hypothetical protein [Xanthomonas arboricola]PPT56495.1 hypothetical protein XarbCFBP8138_06900 [Xanthomonas arboricola]